MGIYISSIEKYNNKKQLIRWDNGIYYPIYNSMKRSNSLEVGIEVDDDVYEELYKKAVIYAKRRAAYLLKDMDRSIRNLRTKLKLDGYCPEIIDCVIDYLVTHKWVDDRNLAINYIEYNKHRYSKIMLITKLKEKGISSDIVLELLEEIEYDESVALDHIISKKGYDANLDDKQKQKAIRYLMSQGFSYSDISSRLASFDDFL